MNPNVLKYIWSDDFSYLKGEVINTFYGGIVIEWENKRKIYYTNDNINNLISDSIIRPDLEYHRNERLKEIGI